jgi:hypothetical protein
MGREATCRCEWGGEEAEVRALLETDALILRGGMRRSIQFASMEAVLVQGESLQFRVGPDTFALKLGAKAAASWAKAIAEPPTLAKKLGISSGTRIAVFGVVDDAALQEAFAQAASEGGGAVQLIFLVVRTAEELQSQLDRSNGLVSTDSAIWVVFPKGKNKAIGEMLVRETLRALGMVDTKVASVSHQLTALRFSPRRPERRRG